MSAPEQMVDVSDPDLEDVDSSEGLCWAGVEAAPTAACVDGGEPVGVTKKKSKKHKAAKVAASEQDEQKEGNQQQEQQQQQQQQQPGAPAKASSHAINVQSGKGYEEEFELETQRMKAPKVKNTPWGSSYREAPEILHGYTHKVTGVTPSERLDMRAATKSDKFCK